jgi:Xaa-Pro dipeptidase
VRVESAQSRGKRESGARVKSGGSCFRERDFMSFCMRFSTTALAGVLVFACSVACNAAGEAAATPAALNRVAKIQAALKEQKLDGWLFYDFRGTNPIATRVLLLQGGGSRRWFYFIPASGTPVRIVHAIEPRRLDSLPGEKKIYGAWPTLQTAIRDALKGQKRIAMEYSPDGAIPYVARVDAGTIDFVRSTGVTVVTSGELVQQFEAVWTTAQREQHERAAKALRQVVDEAWGQIARAIRNGEPIDERAVQQRCTQRKEELGLTSEPPIVAVTANAADPHYFPVGTRSSPIRRGDLVLIDIIGKMKEPGAVFADITWMGVVDDKVPERFARIFQIVIEARDAAVEFVRARARSGNLPSGAQVDDVARGVIVKAGYGANFIHRTGHSIGEEVHGNGTHLDNFETHDDRRMLPHTCFSIEPGIYLPGDFGVRSEVNVYLDGNDAIVTGGPVQREIVAILAR